jgi:hypothetical protein
MRKGIIALTIAITVCLPFQCGCGQRRATYTQRVIMPPANVQVWVNTRSGVYHYPGTANYGRTKNGVYMTEQEAIGRGFHPAHNNQ